MAKQPTKQEPKAEKKAKTLEDLQAARLPILEDREANRQKSNFDVEFEAMCNGKLQELNIAIAEFGEDILA